MKVLIHKLIFIKHTNVTVKNTFSTDIVIQHKHDKCEEKFTFEVAEFLLRHINFEVRQAEIIFVTTRA